MAVDDYGSRLVSLPTSGSFAIAQDDGILQGARRLRAAIRFPHEASQNRLAAPRVPRRLFRVRPPRSPSITGPVDPLAFSQLKDFRAYRSSSNWPEPEWNDDSKHPAAGRDADDRGPERPRDRDAHLDDGLGQRVRLAASPAPPVYYDGSAAPSVDVPARRLLRRRHGMEREIRSLMIRISLGGRARNSYWPMPFEKSCRITITNEGTRRVGLYYHVDWDKVPSLPPNTAYFHAWYRQALPAPADGKPWVFLDTQGRGFTLSAPCSRCCRPSRPGSAKATTSRRRREGRLDPGEPDRRTTSTTRGACTSRRASTPARRSPRGGGSAPG